MEEAQALVAAFVARHGLAVPVVARLLDLTAEVGELAKEALKGSDYGAAPLVLPATWTEELADVLFVVLCLANSTGVDLATALAAVLAKYDQRIAARGDAGSGR